MDDWNKTSEMDQEADACSQGVVLECIGGAGVGAGVWTIAFAGAGAGGGGDGASANAADGAETGHRPRSSLMVTAGQEKNQEWQKCHVRWTPE